MKLPVEKQRRPSPHRGFANALLVMGVFVGVVLSGCATTKCQTCQTCMDCTANSLLGANLEKSDFSVTDNGKDYSISRT